jgi:hypothetical protein
MGYLLARRFGRLGVRPRSRHSIAARRVGDVVLELQNISLAFGGVKALADITSMFASTKCAQSSDPMAPARARCERHQRRLTIRSRA